MKPKPICPECGSKKVEYVSKGGMALNLFSTSLGLLPISIFIPFMLWVSGVCMVLAILVPFGTSFWQCKECKTSFLEK